MEAMLPTEMSPRKVLLIKLILSSTEATHTSVQKLKFFGLQTYSENAINNMDSFRMQESE